jgi:hypothetical protein
MASQGYNNSGNMMTALAKYGGDFFNAERNFLANASGIGFGPQSTAGLDLQGNQIGLDLASRSLASIGYGLGGGRSSSDALLMALLASRGA